MQQPAQTTPSATKPARSSSKVGITWVFLAVFALLLILLLIFIIQNSGSVKIHYFGFSGTIGFGVAMLLSAAIGCILTILIGTIRIVQLKVANKKIIKESEI